MSSSTQLSSENGQGQSTQEHHLEMQSVRSPYRRNDRLWEASDVGKLISIRTLRQFQLRSTKQLSQREFIGLCAYLYILVRWGYPLPPMRFDFFILSHENFRQQQLTNSGQNPSYHRWIEKRLEQTEQLSPIDRLSILTVESLTRIAQENPYTVLRTEWTMRAAAAIESKDET